MSDEGNDDYNSSHRAFLQAFLSRSVLTFKDARPILAAILSAHDRPTLEEDITWGNFSNYVHTVNAALGPFDYEIRSTYPQTATSRQADEALYALVNTSSDPQTQLATAYSADEIAFVKRILDAIFDTNNTQAREVMAIKGMDAVRLSKVRDRDRQSGAAAAAAGLGGAESQQLQPTQASAGSSLTLDRAEKVLDSLVEEGWFEKSAMGYYSLSTRALMELRSWLVDTYNDEEDDDEDEDDQRQQEWQRIKFCETCREIITVGQRCSNSSCNCRLHDFCVRNFFHDQSSRKCPLCGSDWTGQDFVGERAVRGASIRHAID